MSSQPPTPALFPGQEDADHGYKLIVVSCIFSVLCIAVVVARFFAVRKRKAELWWDDWLCIPSLFFALSLNAINIIMVQVAGVGRHETSFGAEAPDILSKWAKILYYELLIYSFAVPLPKLVVLLFYIRIFSNPSFKVAVYAVAFIVIAWCPAVFFTAIFQCNPVAFTWNKSIRGGTCIDVLAFFRYVAVPIVVSDVAVLVLPLPMIWQLQMATKHRLALSGVFILGSLGLIASVARMIIFFRSNAFADPTWTAVTLLLWTMVEVEAVLIAGCLPPLRPLFVNFWQSSTRFISRISASRKTHQSSSSHGRAPQKQGFACIEEGAGIRRTSEVELVPMDPICFPKDGQAGAIA